MNSRQRTLQTIAFIVIVVVQGLASLWMTARQNAQLLAQTEAFNTQLAEFTAHHNAQLLAQNERSKAQLTELTERSNTQLLALAARYDAQLQARAAELPKK